MLAANPPTVMQHHFTHVILALFALTIAGCTNDSNTPEIGPKNLTSSDSNERYPRWSPDGNSLLFESDRSGNWDVYVVNSNGSELRPLAASPDAERFPTWAPDGSRIAFVVQDSLSSKLAVLELSDSSVTIFEPHESGSLLFLDWAPESDRLAYTLQSEESLNLYVFDLDTQVSSVLREGEFRSLWPRWSPDGSVISYFSRMDTEGEDDEVYVISLADSLVRRITTRVGHDFCPTWSPTAEYLAVATVHSEHRRQISVVNLDGTLDFAVGKGFERVTEPDWSPDGNTIAYIAHNGGSYDLYTESIYGE